ncbi:hypothetical protein [Xylanibacter muris]|uniref:Gingipain propeptide domain-containing protein n=1 Tax=Xylanibacter muris TaxID=2736290 RepID=A0ABX2AP72_9BACT|nr:hypothetical protein [Xylanibacter muris]NPD93046.1 hypothetical protein [Xylanibacter muris]
MKRLLSTILLLTTVICSLTAQITGSVSISKEDLVFSERNDYDVIRLKDSYYTTTQTGAPELPVIIKTFVIPQNTKVTALDINLYGSTKLKGKYMPFPVQPPITVGGNEETEFTALDPSIYNNTSPYPGKHGGIVADYNEMGYHLVRIMLCPVSFDPVSRELTLNNISFSLKYESCEPSGIQPEAQSGRRASMIKKYIKSIVDNPQDVDRSVKAIAINSDLTLDKYPNGMTIDAISEQIPDYIIITNNKLKSEFKRLAQWKTQKGVPANHKGYGIHRQGI